MENTIVFNPSCLCPQKSQNGMDRKKSVQNAMGALNAMGGLNGGLNGGGIMNSRPSSGPKSSVGTKVPSR